jgi:hypothetical protein
MDRVRTRFDFTSKAKLVYVAEATVGTGYQERHAKPLGYGGPKIQPLVSRD